MEIALRDLLYILVLAIGVAGSHFVLRAKVMVLEERSRNHGHQFDHYKSYDYQYHHSLYILVIT